MCLSQQTGSLNIIKLLRVIDWKQVRRKNGGERWTIGNNIYIYLSIKTQNTMSPSNMNLFYTSSTHLQYTSSIMSVAHVNKTV